MSTIKTGRNSAPKVTNLGTQDQSVDNSNLIPQEALQGFDLDVPQVKEADLDHVQLAFKAKYNIDIAQAPKLVTTIHERMLKYEREMAPNVTIYSPADGADKQLHLFNTFMRALGATGNDLYMAVDVILAHIYSLRETVYSTRMVYRFIKNINRDFSEVDSYLKILEIFLQISEPSRRVELSNSKTIRSAVANIDPRYKDAAFALVTYLSQYKA